MLLGAIVFSLNCQFETSSLTGQRLVWPQGRITYVLDLVNINSERGENPSIIMTKAKILPEDPETGEFKEILETFTVVKKGDSIANREGRRERIFKIVNGKVVSDGPEENCQATRLKADRILSEGFFKQIQFAFQQFDENHDAAQVSEWKYKNCLKAGNSGCQELREIAATAAAARDHEWQNIALVPELMVPAFQHKTLGRRSVTTVFSSGNGFAPEGDHDLMGVLVPQGDTQEERSQDALRWAKEREREEENVSLIRGDGQLP